MKLTHHQLQALEDLVVDVVSYAEHPNSASLQDLTATRQRVLRAFNRVGSDAPAPDPLPSPLTVGHYLTRNGTRASVVYVRPHETAAYPLVGFLDDDEPSISWTADGRYIKWASSDHDLVTWLGDLS